MRWTRRRGSRTVLHETTDWQGKRSRDVSEHLTTAHGPAFWKRRTNLQGMHIIKDHKSKHLPVGEHEEKEQN